MKKFLSFLLVLSMLLAMVVIPVSAADGTDDSGAESAKTKVYNFTEEDIADQALETVTVGGTTYTVIYTPQQFIAMAPTGTTANFILACDLDFKDVTLTASSGDGGVSVVNAGSKLHNFILEGNGCTLDNMVLNFDTQYSGLFPTATFRTSTIRHLTINAKGNFTASYCAVLYGNTTNTRTKLVTEYVTINADIKTGGQRSAVFIGQNLAGYHSTNKVHEEGYGAYFTGCVATGNWDFYTTSACHVGGFIGYNNARATFDGCSIDANVLSVNNRIAGYIGAQYGTADVSFTDCSARGNLFENAETKWLSGYVGGVYAACNITFNGCSSDVNIVGASANSGYVGGVNSVAAVLSFDSCTFRGTVVSKTKAAGFIGDNSGMSNVSATFKNCSSDGTIVVAGKEASGTGAFVIDADKFNSIEISENCTDSVTTKLYVAEDAGLTNGEAAYEMYKAQIDAEFAETMTMLNGKTYSLMVGQDIGNDEEPAVGGARVYKTETSRGYVMYSNTVSEVSSFTASVGDAAQGRVQVADTAEGVKSVRVLIDVDEAYLSEIYAMTLTVEFATGADSSKVLTVKDTDIELYYSVIAENAVWETVDGRVLIIAVVSGIPTSEWTGDMRITLVTDGSAEAEAAYSYASGVFNALAE